jgi:hypothetical protein
MPFLSPRFPALNVTYYVTFLHPTGQLFSFAWGVFDAPIKP